MIITIIICSTIAFLGMLISILWVIDSFLNYKLKKNEDGEL